MMSEQEEYNVVVKYILFPIWAVLKPFIMVYLSPTCNVIALLGFAALTITGYFTGNATFLLWGGAAFAIGLVDNFFKMAIFEIGEEIEWIEDFWDVVVYFCENGREITRVFFSDLMYDTADYAKNRKQIKEAAKRKKRIAKQEKKEAEEQAKQAKKEEIYAIKNQFKRNDILDVE